MDKTDVRPCPAGSGYETLIKKLYLLSTSVGKIYKNIKTRSIVMLIAETEIKKEFLRSKCNPSAQSIHCIVHLKKDISKVIPYLNAELGGDACSKKPPFVTFKVMGKLITIHPDKIAINALKDFSIA